MGADVLVEEGGVPLNKMKRNLKAGIGFYSSLIPQNCSDHSRMLVE